MASLVYKPTWSFKGALSVPIQFLAPESPLKMTKNAIHSTLNVLFVPKVFEFITYLFSHVEKRLT